MGAAFDEVDISAMGGNLVKRGMHVIDVGAHIGQETFRWALKVGPEGVIHSFEPNPELFAALSKRAGQEGYENIRLYNLAICDVTRDDGEFIMFKGAGNLGSLDTERELQRSGVRVPVATARLDDLPFEKVDLLKIDVDGLDGKVLQGAQSLIAKHRPIIFLEWSARCDPLTKWMIHMFKKHDYRIVFLSRHAATQSKESGIEKYTVEVLDDTQREVDSPDQISFMVGKPNWYNFLILPRR